MKSGGSKSRTTVSVLPCYAPTMEEIGAKVRRSPVPPGLPGRQLKFQMLDCCQVKGSPSATCSELRWSAVPIIRLYGVTEEGNSVLVHCYNFEPYLYIEAPSNWSPEFEGRLVQQMNRLLAPSTMCENTVVRIKTHNKRGLLYFIWEETEIEENGVKKKVKRPKNKPHLKIVVQLPQHVPRVRKLLGDGLAFDELWDGQMRFPTFESNVIFPLRFLVDNDIGGCNWMTIDAGRYFMVPPNSRTSLCQIEIECDFRALKNHEPVGEFMSIAPFRILSIDIECAGRKGFFPEAEHDPVIQIANYLVPYGSDEPLSRCIFTVGSCAAIAGADVYSYDTEEKMLVAWADYLRLTDPDIFTGYNITGFDFPYLINRANTLRIGDRFCYWSRQMLDRTTAKVKTFQSKQMGNREYTEVSAEGRVVMDVMVVIQRDYKLRSYSLNSVSQNFLGEQKEDVHHSIISDLQHGDHETRRRLAVYCLKDAYLPFRLIQKLMIVVNNVEMARVTGVPIAWLLERGQQIKVFSQILRKALTKDLLFPTVEFVSGSQTAAAYEGGHVIPPTKGFYNTPIATLDFSSLYPSIMMAHNLCYSTLVRPNERGLFAPEEVTITPSNDMFVTTECFPGILPEILKELLAARKKAKSMMKDAKDPLEYAVLNGRQLALKISANSVYGFTGAQVGKLPCLEISASVTSFGRTMIEATKELVEKLYEGTNVIYGDTDSVMIKCVTDENADDATRLDQAMKFGKEAADEVSKTFKAPIKLEFEKVYFPYLLMNKKRYAGLLWTNNQKYDKLDAKGIETVRRDNCPLIANVISGVLNRILIHRSVDSAIEFVKGTISDLLMNRLDISQLVITKAFTKSEEEYEGKQAHVALVERMRQRDAASAPTIGDRVAYVIVKAAKGAKAFERSEDPIYVLENNIPIDTQYYLDHALAPPLLRVFEAVLDDPSILLKGAHTRHISQAAPSANLGGLMRFVKVVAHCLSCRCALPDNAAVCANCKDKTANIYGQVMAKRNHYEAIYSKVWTQCQQCQGSLYQEVLCSSRDCPVFYLRKKVQKDLKDQQAILDRFGIVDDW